MKQTQWREMGSWALFAEECWIGEERLGRIKLWRWREQLGLLTALEFVFSCALRIRLRCNANGGLGN